MRAPATQSPKVAFLTLGAVGGRPPGLPLFFFGGAVGTVFGSMRYCLGLATQRVY